MIRDKVLVKECREAWDGLGIFRRNRRRCKDFAYGRQWGDSVRLPSGRIVSEEQNMIESGRIPATNNLIGRMLRQITGYYRYMTGDGGREDGRLSLGGGAGSVGETDVRSLEEFLISGMCVQRVRGSDESWLPGEDVVNFSPERVFFKRFDSPDGSDARFIGLLHEIPLSVLMERFGRDDQGCASRIFENFRQNASGGQPPCVAAQTDFGSASADGLMRVVEVWRRHRTDVMSVYDVESGELAEGVRSRRAESRLAAVNASRRREGRPELIAGGRVADHWEHSWLLADGSVLGRRHYPDSHQPRVVVRLYPMTDGEVHSMVETVIDQQKFVNRLVGLLDEILASSAKGAVLYPVDQLPDGMTWKELRRLWSSPSAILPFKRTSKSIQPRQLSAAGGCAGATELLRTQLKLFDDISGSGGMLSQTGRQASGAEMARLQRDESMIAMLDLLAAFRSFAERRDRLILRVR